MGELRRARQELDPKWRERRDAHGRLRADRARIFAILSTHPHPDPADRSPEARSTLYAGRLSDGFRERQAAVAVAKAVAKAAMEKRGLGTRLLSAIGMSTPEQRSAEQATERARLVIDEEERLRPTPQTYAHARADGAAHAYAAQRDTATWEGQPKVQKALEHARLNGLVNQAAHANDLQVTRALRAGDSEAARAVILSASGIRAGSLRQRLYGWSILL